MLIPLFDIQASILGYAPGTTDSAGAEELLASAERLGITRTLVRREPEIGGTSDPMHANETIYAACEAHPGLVPCPIVVPNTAYDLPDETEQVADAIHHGAAAAYIRCGADHWFAADWVSDNLFGAVSERALPVYVGSETMSQRELATIAERFPRLPIIYTQIDYRAQRTLLPLLETFPNIYASIGNPYNIHMGIEQIIERVGPTRLLFGTGFPGAEQTAAVTYLTYANISEEEKALIGSANMDRLIGAIQE
tara:strand:- start:2455 stop:3210 length:756 start_codon:yes stop_codon:yes gene_type:complete